MNKEARVAGRRLLPVYQQLDELIEEQKIPEQSSCKRGCNSCCYLLVAISLMEAVYIADHLLENESWRVQLPELKKKLREQADRIDALGGIGNGEAVSSPYLRTRTPCVFLKKNGDCGIYRHRPATCRTYFVLTPAEHCSPDRPNHEVKGFDMRRQIFEVWAETFDQSVVPNLADSLQRMVLVALELLERKPAAFKEWLKHVPHHDLPDPRELIKFIDRDHI